MIICKFTYSNDEERYETLDEAEQSVRENYESCMDDGMLAENLYEVMCDLQEAQEEGIEAVAEQDENGNWVFER